MTNTVVIAGFVGKAPEVRNLEGGNVVTQFGVAQNKPKKNASGEWENSTEWWNVSCFGYVAEDVGKRNILTGDLLYIVGRLGQSEYTDKEGVTRKDFKIIAASVQVLKRGAAYNAREVKQEVGTEKPLPPNTENQEDDLPF
jgi:single-strand DNA-binding protein